MRRARYMRLGVTHHDDDLMSRLVIALSSVGKEFKAFVFVDPETFDQA